MTGRTVRFTHLLAGRPIIIFTLSQFIFQARLTYSRPQEPLFIEVGTEENSVCVGVCGMCPDFRGKVLA